MRQHGHALSTIITADENDLFPADQLAAAWDEAVQLTGDRNLGLHLGEQSTIGRWGIVEQLLNHSSSFQECIDHSIRYWKLVGFSDLDIGYQETVRGKHNTSAITLRTAAPYRQIAESDAVYTIRMMKMLLANDFVPSDIWFMHEQPDDTSEHQRIFGLTPTFNQDYLAVFFDQSWSEGKRAIDPAITAAIQQLAEQRLVALEATDSIVEKVTVILQQAPATTVAKAAQALHMSTRTLQNKLEHAGKPYKVIKDELRTHKAKQLLADQTLSLGEIAFMLGFSDSSTFSHYCKRSLGLSPSQWRDQLTVE